MNRFDFRLSRRCIAVDLGQSRIKAVLAERKRGRLEILHAFTLDLQEEGLLSLEETNRQVSRILLEMGEYPVSLVIPQHIAISHLIALPSVSRRGWDRMIEQETQKLTGLSESTIVYDYFRLHPFRRNRNPVWVTVSREKELEAQIQRLHGSGLEVGEVTNTGNALASAYLATQPAERRVVLVEVGAASTTIVAIQELQPVYATSFPFGGELLTEAVANARGIGFDEAETLKKTEYLLGKESGQPEVLEAIDGWQHELRKVISEWLKDDPDTEDEPLKVMLSGGVSQQAGFLEYLNANSPFRFGLWSDRASGIDLQTYAVVYGTALAGLKVAPISTTLLPKPLRQERTRAKQVTALNALAAMLLIVLFVLLLSDTAVRREALRARADVIADVNIAYQETESVGELLAVRHKYFNQIVPIVQQQKQTRDLLKTISLMQEVRAEHEAWFVLLADGRSYQEAATYTLPANGAGRESRSRSFLEPTVSSREEETDPAWNRFVVEISVPGSGREIHDILRNVVDTFASKGIFRNVDTMAAAERKQLVAPEVTLPDETFPLNLELIPSEFSLLNGASSSTRP